MSRQRCTFLAAFFEAISFIISVVALWWLVSGTLNNKIYYNEYNICIIIIVFMLAKGIFYHIVRTCYFGRYASFETYKHGTAERVKVTWIGLDFITNKEERFRCEYLLNALVNPKAVFLRVNESIEPSSRTLAVSTRLDMRGANNTLIRERLEHLRLGYRRTGCNFHNLEVLVPVAYARRGKLVNRTRAYGSSGERVPIVEQETVNRTILSILDALFESHKVETAWHHVRESLGTSLADTSKATQEYYITYVMILIDNTPIDEETKKALKTLVARLGKSYVQSISQVLGDAKLQTVRIKRRVFLVRKAAQYVGKQGSTGTIANPPSCMGKLFSRIAYGVNCALNMVIRGSGTFYYDLSAADLSDSYHLTLLGPEDTFCAQSTLYLFNDKGPTEDAEVMMEERSGQRHAHVYVRGAQNYYNVDLMFHYIGRPPDLFLASSLLTITCSACIMVACAVCLGRTCGGDASDIPAVLLLVLSGACPWFFDQARSDRTESLLLSSAMVWTSIASMVGLCLYFSRADDILCLPTSCVWTLLIVASIMLSDILLEMGLLHGALYRSLRFRNLAKTMVSNQDDGKKSSLIPSRPAGWKATNGYRHWESKKA